MTSLSIILCVAMALLGEACQQKEPERQASDGEQTPQPVAGSQRVPRFDGKRAFDYLVAQTQFGPRVPGTGAHRNCLNFLTAELRNFADTTYLQPFTHRGFAGKVLHLTNIIASWNPEASRRILLCAHWDTRPWADQDPDPKNRTKPILGANDGASGVAVLLEIARLLKSEPLSSVGIDIVLFDAEDYGRGGENYLIGSKYFAGNKSSSYTPEFGILLDMIGDEQLEIPKERNSVRYAPDILELIWSTARDLGSTAFIDALGEEVYDDHIPLNEAGIKTVNLIDFNYPDRSHRYWHTLEDTPDKCSAGSLEEVGNVLLHVIYRRLP